LRGDTLGLVHDWFDILLNRRRRELRQING
jgi:hypothetical protein